MKNFKELIFTCKAISDNILSFLGSDATVDRAGDIMTLSGWKLDAFKKNPVFLWAHNYSYPPIGKAVRVEITDKGLEFDIEFVKKEIDPFADQIRMLYKEGFLNATSVGFIPLKVNPNPDGTNAIVEKELLELSGVPVPCNPNALQMAMQKGILDDAGFKRLNAQETADVESLKKRVADLENMIKESNAHAAAPELFSDAAKASIKTIYDVILKIQDKGPRASLPKKDLEFIEQIKSNLKE